MGHKRLPGTGTRPESASGFRASQIAPTGNSQLSRLPSIRIPALFAVVIFSLFGCTAICWGQNEDNANEADEQTPPAKVDAAQAQPPKPLQPDGIALVKNARKLAIIDIEGPIFGRFHWYLTNRMEWAKQQGADVVMIRLTSPGGELNASIELARLLRDTDWATTIVFIPEEAISGGAIISLGADRIYMQKSAMIGDAGPIQMRAGGQFEHAEEKIVSYLGTACAGLADDNGRPKTLARAMVDRKLVVMETRDIKTGKTVFLSKAETQDPIIGPLHEVIRPVPETGQDRFLTVTSQRALELQLCEGVFKDEQALLDAISPQQIVRTEMTWVDKTVFILNSPMVTGLLLIIGLIGLYIELAAPGIGAGGLTALLCFGVFFWSHMLGGTAGWLEILLFGLAIVCLGCEMFLLPGFGVFGITGIGLMILALTMSTQAFFIPQTDAQWTVLQTNFTWILAAVFGVLALGVVQLMLFDSLPGLKRFQLRAAIDNGPETESNISSLTSTTSSRLPDVTAGDSGVADSDLRPAGKVRINDTLIDVVTEGDYVEAGSNVDILRVEGNRIVVRKKA